MPEDKCNKLQNKAAHSCHWQPGPQPAIFGGEMM